MDKTYITLTVKKMSDPTDLEERLRYSCSDCDEEITTPEIDEHQKKHGALKVLVDSRFR